MNFLNLKKLLWLYLLLLSCFALNAPQAQATLKQRYAPDTPSLLTAQAIDFNDKDHIITAEGNVIISQNERILRADKIIYYRSMDLIVALGNVYLEEPTGEIIFVNYLEVTNDLKAGFAQQARMILSDNSKLAAASVTRSTGSKNEFERVVYSPCHLCKVDKTRPPIWQIKARHVLWDQEAQKIEYSDAYLEMFGIPVFYTPYLSHPDPTVERKTGFLAPSFGGGSDMGAAISTPYFINIAPNKDLTLTPIIGSSAQILMAQYRQRFSKGIMDVTGSAAHVSKKRDKREGNTHWHIDALGRYDLSQNWRLGANLIRSGNRNYVRKYSKLGVQDKSVLTSKAFAEGFYNQSYLNIQAISFQGLRPEDRQKTIPLVAPMIDINLKSQPQWQESWWTMDLNTLALSRKEGPSSRRVSATGGWHAPYQSKWGDLYQLDLIFRTDAYHTESFVPAGEKKAINCYQGRVFPQAALHWLYPFANTLKTTQIILTPQASFIGSPNIGTRNKIPNEDSRIFELSDMNILDNNRQPGLDQLDSGSRINYGIETSILGLGAGATSVFVGQSYDFHNPQGYLMDTGVNRGSSDYVVRAQAFPIDLLKLRYRARLDRKRLQTRRNELSLDLGPPLLRGSLDYIHIAKPKNSLTDEQGGQQIFLGLSSTFVKYWTGSIGTTRELGSGGGALSQYVGLKYQDECFTFNTTLTKTFFRDKDIRPGVTLWFSIEFKNLGGVSQSLSRGGTPRESHKTQENGLP